MKITAEIEGIIYSALAKYKFFPVSELHMEGNNNNHDLIFYYKCTAQSQCHYIGLVDFSFRALGPNAELQKESIESEILNVLEGRKEFLLIDLKNFPLPLQINHNPEP